MIWDSRAKLQVSIMAPNLQLRSNKFKVPQHENGNESESYYASVRATCFDPACRVNGSEITIKCLPFLLLKVNILIVKIPGINFTNILSFSVRNKYQWSDKIKEHDRISVYYTYEKVDFPTAFDGI
jgi:hypothetical protein